ncbi:YcfL family protein [Geminisphaera colitermitum]|uniref:YcfL family protein n=1 Tax=Geminisphaera colitermitum TaxID=1148786 RepID=UPI0005B7A1FF|nr:YcfL family protein [Geminisphaera colitermitum]
MKTKSSTCLAATLVLGVLSIWGGCATSVNSIERAQPESRPNYVSDQRVATDSTLARALRVVSVNQGFASGNLLQIQATIENLKSGERTYRYKLDWIDENGMAAGGTGWRLLHLRGREISTVSAIATTPRVADFRLKFEAQ